MTLSERHHYIPEFMIKGFVGNDNKISVYNIKDDKLECNRKSPKQVFFEWNRNTVEINGIKTDLIEKLYQLGENIFAPVYKNIITKTSPIKLETIEIFHIIFYISVLHYRLPINDTEINEILRNTNNVDLLFKILNKETKEEATSDVYNECLNSTAFAKIAKSLLAIRDFTQMDNISNFEKWKIYYSDNGPKLHIISDNPIIFRNKSGFNIFESELIFRLSCYKTVYYSNGKIMTQLTPEHSFKVDLLTFLQSERIVCGPDKEYLNTISKVAKLYDNERKIAILKEDVFKIFD